jgi:hypothetical protein
MAPFVKLDAVWAMLDECLPGHERKASGEYWTVKRAGRSYRRIPLGPHGRKQNVSIQSGHIRSVVRFFEINADCVEQYLDLT